MKKSGLNTKKMTPLVLLSIMTTSNLPNDMKVYRHFITTKQRSQEGGTNMIIDVLDIWLRKTQFRRNTAQGQKF
jgi:hypothetical protein